MNIHEILAYGGGSEGLHKKSWTPRLLSSDLGYLSSDLNVASEVIINTHHLLPVKVPSYNDEDPSSEDSAENELNIRL